MTIAAFGAGFFGALLLFLIALPLLSGGIQGAEALREAAGYCSDDTAAAVTRRANAAALPIVQYRGTATCAARRSFGISAGIWNGENQTSNARHLQMSTRSRTCRQIVELLVN